MADFQPIIQHTILKDCTLTEAEAIMFFTYNKLTKNSQYYCITLYSWSYSRTCAGWELFYRSIIWRFILAIDNAIYG